MSLQAHQLQQFTHLLLALQLGHAGDFERQFDVLPHGLGRHQVEVLEDHADAPAQRHQPVFVEVADVDLIDQHAPAAGLLQAVDGADQRRLAGAAAADDAEHFPALDRQVDTLAGHPPVLAVIGFAQADKTHMGAGSGQGAARSGSASWAVARIAQSRALAAVMFSSPSQAW